VVVADLEVVVATEGVVLVVDMAEVLAINSKEDMVEEGISRADMANQAEDIKVTRPREDTPLKETINSQAVATTAAINHLPLSLS